MVEDPAKRNTLKLIGAGLAALALYGGKKYGPVQRQFIF